jgi:hypothetical protein
MVDRNDVDGDELLQQIVEHLRRQEIPAFPNPEIAVSESTKRHVTSVHSFSPLRRIVMNRRFQLSVGAIVGLAAVLGFLLLWGGIAANPVSAMEQMAESIRKAKSFRAMMIAEGQFTPEAGKPPVKHNLTCTLYWLAKRASRLDFSGCAPNEGGGPSIEAEVTKIDVPGESREIIIDHKAKTFCKVELPKGVPGAEMVAKLGEFSGQADSELGTKEINGKKSRGFGIDMQKLFNRPGISERGIAEIWIDTESSLPVLVQITLTRDRSKQTIRIQDFHWNIDLDPKLFDTTLPRGYADVTSSFAVPPKSSATRSGTHDKLKKAQ